MKTLFIFFLLFISVKAFSQDSAVMISKLQEKVLAQQKEIERLEKEEATAVNPVAPADPCLDCQPELGWLWFYVLMPVILSLVVALYFLRWLKKEGFRISDAISTDVPEERLEAFQTAMVENGLTASADQTSTPTPPVNRSSSRLIAFLSSLSASVLAICTFSYYMYFAIKGMEVPEFEELWPILTALGLGIVPYATKVINGKTDSPR
ncbi:hypothetical protein [Algoriphagus litoralis]|uniref:hypothetical protein n=1 Tax=Algoriphagus litoralis TaxID=2202829 RepID=UPI001300A08E|nr:hypothetical protein [Algoriphagus litoralis]